MLGSQKTSRGHLHGVEPHFLFSRVDSDISATNRGKEKLISNLIFDCRLALPEDNQNSTLILMWPSQMWPTKIKLVWHYHPCFILSSSFKSKICLDGNSISSVVRQLISCHCNLGKSNEKKAAWESLGREERDLI